ncbi:MAG TPA: metal-dependent hydrolase [Verrucomicrobiae bacterium]|nr:metal-dependent hydrolase [Verrucomicrobiae bacterium]
MEPFTHAFSSLALARAGQKRLPRLGTAIVVVAGLAPDLDYASYFGGASAFMRFHRTAMHSLAGAALTACAIAAAFCVLDRRLPPKKTAQGIAPRLGFGSALAASVVGIAGHVLLDLASGMGVQLLWPFRARWWAWDLARNFDPWVLFLLVAGLLLPILFKLVNEEVTSGHKKRSGAGSAILTLFLIAAYFGARAHLHREAVDLLLSREYHGRVGLTAEAFPKTATPFIWRGIVTTDNTLEEVEVPVNQPDAFDPNDSVTLYKPEDSPALEVSEKSSAAAKYLEYARVPIASVRHNEADYRVEVRDARFPLEDDDPANIILRIELSSTYQIRKEEFLFPADANR